MQLNILPKNFICIIFIYLSNSLFLNAENNFVTHKEVHPEKLILFAIKSIQENKLDRAMKQINTLIESEPNFKLAHIIKADLLLANVEKINGFGNGSTNFTNQALKEEMKARYVRSLLQRNKSKIPSYFLKLPESTQFVMFMDSSVSTLYVYEQKGSELIYVKDFYVSIGKRGVSKQFEGDKKTPIGLYNITSEISKKKLSDFYGAGAFPINYPNNLDLVNGKTGHGIWLHGTPINTYSRAPKASDGCIVLTNDDFDEIKKYVTPGITPIAITKEIQWLDRNDSKILMNELISTVKDWEKAWESLNTENYLSYYSKNFKNKKYNYQSWAKKKYRVNKNKKYVNIDLKNISVSLSPQKDELALIKFQQNYFSSNLNDETFKQQYWEKEKGKWKIIFEGVL